MKDSDDLQKLLRLKRYETPGEEYFQNFTEEFKDRQRAQLLQGSARSLLFERASMWFDEVSPNRWVTPVAAAACLLLLGIATISISQSERGTSAEPAVAEAPATLPEFEENPSEVIELSLPKLDRQVPGESISQGDRIMTVGLGQGFREL